MRKCILGIAAVVLVGCCTHTDYRPLLRQTRDNLVNDIGPKYKGYLNRDTTRPEDLRRNDAAVVDDTVAAIDRVLGREAGDE